MSYDNYDKKEFKYYLFQKYRLNYKYSSLVLDIYNNYLLINNNLDLITEDIKIDFFIKKEKVKFLKEKMEERLLIKNIK